MKLTAIDQVHKNKSKMFELLEKSQNQQLFNEIWVILFFFLLKPTIFKDFGLGGQFSAPIDFYTVARVWEAYGLNPKLAQVGPHLGSDWTVLFWEAYGLNPKLAQVGPHLGSAFHDNLLGTSDRNISLHILIVMMMTMMIFY